MILDEGWADDAFIAEHTEGLEALRRTVAEFTLDRVARRAGRAGPRASGRRLGSSRPEAPVSRLLERGLTCRPTRHSSSISCVGLNTICGRWQRAGDDVVEPPCLGQPTQPKAQAMPPMRDYAYGFGEKMRVRGLANTAAGMPTAALADEILMPGEGQVRALISHGGNPVAAWPDQLKTIEAMESLDLLVQIDAKMSATASMADYVIAVKHPLEMPGMTLTQEYLSAYAVGFGTTAPYAQYTPALVEPPAGSDLIDDWEFFYGLAQRMDLSLVVRPREFLRYGARRGTSARRSPEAHDRSTLRVRDARLADSPSKK